MHRNILTRNIGYKLLVTIQFIIQHKTTLLMLLFAAKLFSSQEKT